MKRKAYLIIIAQFLLGFLAEAQSKPSEMDSLIVISGDQGGIGIGYDMADGDIQITRIIANGPAEKSGQIEVNDRITGVGEGDLGELKELKSLSLADAGELILGPVGTTVRLAVISSDTNKLDDAKIVKLIRQPLQRNINLARLGTWYFRPGDDLTWADPDFDHTEWLKIRPSGIADPLPDSLWKQGYGWFRNYFKVDSNFYSNNWYLHVHTWGAAEVYIDGKLISKYGLFSTESESEQGYNPKQVLLTSLSITPADTHLIAVRYSYHQAKRNKSIMGDRSNWFGFSVSFYSQESYDQIQAEIDDTKLVFYLLTGIYAIIFILHGYLYFLFRRQKENLLVAIIVALLFCNMLFGNYFRFSEFDRLTQFIFADHLELFRFTLLLLIPYTLVAFFKLYRFEKLKYLPLLAIPFFIVQSSSILPFLLTLILLLFIVFILCVVLLIHAKRNKAIGIGFIAFGFVGMILHVLIPLTLRFLTGSSFDVIGQSVLYEISFLSIMPVSMSLLIAFKMAKLYTGLEVMVDDRTSELKLSLENLKSTQTQLIHSEKMASLGELTAGIAHEIQNPLNFVNNFSDLNKELLEELKDAVAQNDQEEVATIIKDLSENETKINHHGKRAEEIVKSMLQHSRTGSGEKELTDINALADEYLRLSYHGLRAKDKSFNADFKADLDPDLPKINVIPQDIGRVVLNLINNAFQACRERSERTSADRSVSTVIETNGLNSSESGTDYKPEVIVTTKKIPLTPFEKGDSSLEGGRSDVSARGVLITVSDNGSGIPDKVKDKIFQPFFTTKPTGQGTGLGLSMSYDIVTKGHGGTISVKSVEGVGTSFIITLNL